MKKYILPYGLIAGTLLFSYMIVMGVVMQGKDFANMDSGVVVGYTSMLLAFSLVFLLPVRIEKKNWGV